MLVATDIQHAVIGAVELFTDIFLALTSVGDYCILIVIGISNLNPPHLSSTVMT